MKVLFLVLLYLLIQMLSLKIKVFFNLAFIMFIYSLLKTNKYNRTFKLNYLILILVPFVSMFSGIYFDDFNIYGLINIILISIGEELLFRGVLLDNFSAQFNDKAILMSSLLFGILHLVNINADNILLTLLNAVLSILLGYALSCISYYDNNLFICIIVHIMFNIISLFTSANLFVYVILMVLLVLYIIFIKNYGKD